MEIPIGLLIAAVALALLFDFVNGVHDAANSIATIVSTRVLSPNIAVLWAAFFNFIAIVIFAPRVADTIARIIKIQANEISYVYVVLAGLIAAILWGLITWYFGLPSSSSHAIVGGLSGSGIMYGGLDVLRWEEFNIIVIFIFAAPLIGFFFGSLIMLLNYWLFRNCSFQSVSKIFHKGQFISAACYSIGHGANDAQKTMGLIVALLIAGGILAPGTEIKLENPDTMWIVLSCQFAMALGTAIGGWKIVKTMGMKLVKLRPIQGFSAETAGAATLAIATTFGIPVSTTHTITGAIVGSGSVGRGLSHIRWGVATHVIWAWILTIPATAGIAAMIFKLLALTG